MSAQLELTDEQREEAIEAARLRMMESVTIHARQFHFQRMRYLISQRSARQVEKMESARGLR